MTASAAAAARGAEPAVAAVDLGATSGRVVLGRIRGGRLAVEETARFANTPVHLTQGGDDGLYWDIHALYAGVERGIRRAARSAPGLCSVGIDGWAVDYGLLRGGHLLAAPRHYRDPRTAAGVRRVHGTVSAAELFARNGLQHLDFTTLFQLAGEPLLGAADRLLLVPDLVAYWLTGTMRTEATNASTTGLLAADGGGWDRGLLHRLALPEHLFAPLVQPGEPVGAIAPGPAARVGVAPGGVQVTAVGSHDTASAVAAVPFAEGGAASAAYISSGTWSLVGLELDAPVRTPAARAANFTNEAGVDGRVRFLRNVSGLWLLEESLRTWEGSGEAGGRHGRLAELLAAAEAVQGPVPVFDVADPRFVPPGDMPARIRDWCAEHGLAPPRGPAETVRAILESLADAYARTLAEAEALTGRRVETVHVVGGGSRNALLCRLTARRTGRAVLAGPPEAAALGNLLVQARAAGLTAPDASLGGLRALVRRFHPPQCYAP
ncbi:rhamnulokinase [Nocardiopsis coralliicola]